MMSEETFQQWRQRELVILRGIARLLGAYLHETDDPAMRQVPAEIRDLLRQQPQWRKDGLETGWT